MNHQHFMQQCLKLAQKGRGLVDGNPMVGAALVRDGKVVAEGVYMGKGTAHAERALLEEYKADVQLTDVLYVNLEPCCHHGDTLPCIDIIIERGVRTVVLGMKDPDERVAGKGVTTLRTAGIKVIGPILPELCRRLNKGYVSLREQGRPYITLKRAQTKQGAIAQPDGTTLRITSDAQNAWSHQWLRATHDAIAVGVQTVITDDPELTVRFGAEHPQPIPLIFDPELRTPPSAKLVREGTIIVTTKESDEHGAATLLQIPYSNNTFDFAALWKALPNVSSILVEGGQKTWDIFTEAKLVDEEVVLIG